MRTGGVIRWMSDRQDIFSSLRLVRLDVRDAPRCHKANNHDRYDMSVFLISELQLDGTDLGGLTGHNLSAI